MSVCLFGNGSGLVLRHVCLDLVNWNMLSSQMPSYYLTPSMRSNSVCVCVYARWTQRDAILRSTKSTKIFPLSCTDLPPLLLFSHSSSPPLAARDRGIERQEQLFDLSPPPPCFGHPERHKHKIISSLKFTGSMRAGRHEGGVCSSALSF